MNPQNLNSDTYVIEIDASSKKADLKNSYPEGTNIILRNDSDKAVFVQSSESDSETLVYPTSADTPVAGQIILPGAVESFRINKTQRYVYAIQASAGTGNLYITAGEGV